MPGTFPRRPRFALGGMALTLSFLSSACHHLVDRSPEQRPLAAVQAKRPDAASPYSAQPRSDQQPATTREAPQENRAEGSAHKPAPPASPVTLAQPSQSTEPRPLDVREPVEPATPIGRPTGPPPKPLVQALECFLNDKPEEALKWLGGFDPRDQELLLRLLPIVARVERGSLAAAGLRAEQQTLLEVLQSIVAELRLAAPLAIKELVFCERVYGFGKYEPLGRTQFRPGEIVKVYAEVENLAERRDEELHVTAVGGVMEIRGPDCKVKWTHTFPITLDQSSSPRTDHFLRFSLPIPPTLPAGFYTLRIQVRDQHTQRETERSIGFRVTSLASPQLN